MTVNGSFSQTCAIAGIGETPFVKRSNRTSTQLQLEASIKAIRDSGIESEDIDGVIPIGITGGSVEEFVTNLGIKDLRFSAVIPHGGASGIGALQCAMAAVAAGICENVLVAFGRNVSSGARAGSRIHQIDRKSVV